MCGHDPAEVLDRLDAHDARLRSVTLGCSAYALVSDGGGRPHETEGEARALSMLAAWLPRVEVRAFAVELAELPAFDRMDALLQAERETSFLLLTTPGFASAAFVRSLDSLFPNAHKLGAVAFAPGDMPAALGAGWMAEEMGGEDPPASVFCGGRILSSGAVGVALTGDVAVDVVMLSALGFPSLIGALPARFEQQDREGEPARMRLVELGGSSFDAFAASSCEILAKGRLRYGAQLLPAGARSEDSPWVPLTLLWEWEVVDDDDEDEEEEDDDEGAHGQLVAADSEAVAIAGALVAPCSYAASIAAADASYALSHATAELAAARGALLFSACERSAPPSPAVPRVLYAQPGVDTVALCAAAELARGTGAPLPVGGLQAAAPIAPIAGANRSHVHRGSAAVALFRPRWAAGGASAPPRVRHSSEADFARSLAELRSREPSAGALFERGLQLVPMRAAPAARTGWSDAFSEIERNGRALGELLPMLPCTPLPAFASSAPDTSREHRRILFPGISREYALRSPRDVLVARHCASRRAAVGVVLSSPGVVAPGVIGHFVRLASGADGSCVLTVRGGDRFVHGGGRVVPLGFGATFAEAFTFSDLDKGSGTAELMLRALLADWRHDSPRKGDERFDAFVRALSVQCEQGLGAEAASFALCDLLDVQDADIAAEMLSCQSGVDRLDMVSELLRHWRE